MAISHFLLGITSGYALTRIQYSSYPFTHVALCVICSHGCLQLIKSVFCRQYDDTVYELTRISGVLCDYIPLAFINNDVYIIKGLLKQELLYIHAISAIVPAALEICLNGRISENLRDLLTIAHALSMLYLANIDQNIWFCLIAILWLINRFCIQDITQGTTLQYNRAISMNLTLITLCTLKALKPNALEFEI